MKKLKSNVLFHKFFNQIYLVTDMPKYIKDFKSLNKYGTNREIRILNNLLYKTIIRFQKFIEKRK